MVKVGTIAIDLVAHTSKLLKPLKQAEQSLSGFVGKMAKLTGIGAAIAGPVVGLLSLQKAISSVKESFESLGSISNESKRLGIPADQLMALQYAARQADVEMEALGKSLQIFLKGGGRLADLPKIADEIARMKDPARRMQRALQLFGKGGAGMINLFEGGADALRVTVEQAEKLGRAFSQEEVDQVEAAGDAWARIKEAVKGVADRIAISLAPWITWISDKITALATSGEGMGKRMQRVIGWVGDAIVWTADTIDGMRRAFVQLGIGVDVVMIGLVQGFADLVTQVEPYFEALANAWNKTLYEMQSALLLTVAGLADFLQSPLIQNVLSGGLTGAFVNNARDQINAYLDTYIDTLTATIQQREADMPRFDLKLNIARPVQDFAKGFRDVMDGVIASARKIVNNPMWWGGRVKRWARGVLGGGSEEGGATIGGPAFGGEKMVGALQRGSQEAFKTIAATVSGEVQQKQLMELQKLRHNVEIIVDDALILKRANLA